MPVGTRVALIDPLDKFVGFDARINMFKFTNVALLALVAVAGIRAVLARPSSDSVRPPTAFLP